MENKPFHQLSEELQAKFAVYIEDGVSQPMFALNMQLQALKQLEKASTVDKQKISEFHIVTRQVLEKVHNLLYQKQFEYEFGMVASELEPMADLLRQNIEKGWYDEVYCDVLEERFKPALEYVKRVKYSIDKTGALARGYGIAPHE